VDDRHDEEDVRPLGYKLIFSSSHVRSPRFMTQFVRRLHQSLLLIH